jgi:streptogramin lyase
MVVGADNNVWFIDQVGNKIGHVTHAGVITGFFIPQKNSNTVSLTEGPDGAVWFTEAGASMIGRLSSSLVFTHVLVPAKSSPRGITTGSDGNLYYTLYGKHEVGRLNPTTKKTTNAFAVLPSGAGPTRIASGPDGNLWVTETAKNEVARITVPGGVITQVPLPAGSAPSHIVAGADGDMWVTEPGKNRVARITTGATPAVTQVGVPGGPTGITAGGDGKTMWVTESTGNAVARISGIITPPLAVKSFATPTKKSAPGGIVTGGDGNVWFSENAADKIGRLSAVAGHSSYVIVEDGRFSPKSQGVPVSSGSTHKSTTVRWLFQGGKMHSITDSSGMNLFDSGVVGPGTSFTNLFTTAGRFDYHSTAAGDVQTGIINVTPSAVVNGSNIDVTVATAFPAGVTVNVQVKTPGGSFAPAPGGTGISTNTYSYTPSGAGTYRFQVQTAANGHTSGWSPTISVKF